MGNATAPDDTESAPQSADGSSSNGASDGNGSQASAPPPPTAEKKWYIVHTYSGHENKAKLTLLERVRNANLTDYFGDVLVPTEWSWRSSRASAAR